MMLYVKQSVKVKSFSASLAGVKPALPTNRTQPKELGSRTTLKGYLPVTATTKPNGGAVSGQSITPRTKRWSSGSHRLVSFSSCLGQSQKVARSTVLTLLGIMSRGMCAGLHTQSRQQTAYHGGIG